MKTSKPLRELVPEILDYVKLKRANHVVYNKKLLDIWNGQLRKYVDEGLIEALGAGSKSYIIAKQRIPGINVLQQYVNKSGGTYSSPATRAVNKENEVDSDIMANYIKTTKFDDVMAKFENMMLLHRYASFETFVLDGKERARVIDATKYLPFSDSTIDPEEMTVYIKFMKSRKKETMQTVDTNGVKIRNPETIITDVEIYRLYSDTEYLEIDSDGEVLNYIEHNDGIPYVHCSVNGELLPDPDSDTLDTSILIPLMITDINYFIQFCTHSTFYTVDMSAPADMIKAPNAYWGFKSDPGEFAKPQVGSITSTTDTDKIWESVKNELSMWLEGKGLKTNAIGKTDGNNVASGVAKVIDESDTTRVRKRLKNILMGCENEIWKLITKMQEQWTADGIVDAKNYSKDFEVSIQFAEEKPFHDFSKTLDDEVKMLDKQLSTPKLSLSRLFPTATEPEIDVMVEKIDVYNLGKQETLIEGIPGEEIIPDEEEEEEKDGSKS